MSKGTAFSFLQPIIDRDCLKSLQPGSLGTFRLHRSCIPCRDSSKTADRVHAYCARLRSPFDARDKLLYSGFTNTDRKGGDNMLKINYLSTLFVGIDVSSRSNVVYAMDFEQHKLISSSFANNQPGADELAQMIYSCMLTHTDIDTVVIALESTSVYSIHIANFLSSCELLMQFKPLVFCINPKMTANYRKSFSTRCFSDS